MEPKQNNHFLAIDYFRQLRIKAYGETETFDEFVARIAEQYFPGRGEEWQQRYAFSLHFYGLCVAACKDCAGTCPHHGHKYHLRIKKGSAVPIPWASSELCPKYRDSFDQQGRRRTRQEQTEPTQTEAEFDFPMELLENLQEQSQQGTGWPNFSASKGAVSQRGGENLPKQQPKAKVTMVELFDEETDNE